MPWLLWLDSAAYGACATASAAMTLAVLGAGPRRLLNRVFAAFGAFSAAWATLALLSRVTLWLEVGNPLLALELSTLAFALMGPILLAFTTLYVGRRSRWTDLAVPLGLIATAALATPLLRHHVVYNLRLERGFVPTYDVSPLGLAATAVVAAYFAASGLLLWRRRHSEGRTMVGSVLLLLIGTVTGGVLQSAYAVTSIVSSVSFLALAYAILGRQLLNPLRELTSQLQQRVEKQAQELADASARFETASQVLTRRSSQLETAAQVTREAAGILDTRRLLTRTVHLVAEQFGLYHVAIFLLDDAGENAVLRASNSEEGRRLLARGHQLPVGGISAVGDVAAARRPRIARAAEEDRACFGSSELARSQSEVALPMSVRDRVIGVLDVHSQDADAFDQEDVAILQAVADQIAMALQNTRLLAEARDRIRETNILLGRQSREGWAELATERPSWGYRYDGVEVVPSGTTRGADTSPDLTVPLRVRGDAIGYLNLSLGDRPLTFEEMSLAEAVAEQTSLALENSRLFRETQRALRELEAINTITSTVNQSLQLEAVLEQALAQVLGISGFECGLVGLLGPDRRLHLVAAHAVPEALRQPLIETGMEGTLCALVFETGETLALEDLTEDAPLDVESLLSLGLRSYFGTPLESKGETVGTLCAFGYSHRGLSPTIIAMLEAVGQQIGVAVENAQLFEEARRGAERERLIADITAKVRASTDVETILRTAVRELGRALRVADGVIQLGGSDGDGAAQAADGTEPIGTA